MKIYFGVNEYELVPGFDIPGADFDKIDEYINIQIIADEITLRDFEEVIADVNNLKSIRVYNEDLNTNTYFDGYTKIDILKKEFDIIYDSGIDDHIELQPAILNPQTGEEIQAAIYGTGVYQRRADIIYLRVSRGNLVDQVEQNAANIEFIAIMNDIEL